jgi:glycosyltransferase involved in cell wall biosynthesis
MQSEDTTISIAREYTEKIFTVEKLGYVEPARKFAVEQASGDWVLLIDADEMVAKPLSEKLLRIAANDLADVVSIPFKTYIMGDWIRHSGWWPEYHPRFFKRGMITFNEQIHSICDVDCSARKLFLPATEQDAIVHFCYTDSEHFVAKLNRYTSIEAENMLQGGKNFSIFRMFVAGLRGFQVRYLNQSGYRDGYRGLFLGIMMGFYRMLTYIKLWELHENKGSSVTQKYREQKKDILHGHES